MRFFHRAGLVFFADDRPGQNVSMSVDGKSLPFRGDASSFDDALRKYEWAFDYPSLVRPGARFLFTTTDHHVVGKANGGEIQVEEDAVPVPVSVLPVTEPYGEPVPVPVSVELVTEPIVETTITCPVSIPRVRGEVLGLQPKVSIVTATYNRPALLRLACESLRRQTDPDWEHLIYDDGSTDPKMKDVLAWAAEDQRVRVFRGTNINRPSVRWNYLLDRARGRYFTVLDDDNEKLWRFVEVMAGELDADPTFDIVTCGFLVHDEVDDRREPRSAFVEGADRPRLDEHHLNLSTSAARLAEGSTCDGGAVLYRRELFERAGYFSEAIRTNEDWHWLRRAVHTAKIKNLSECLSTYRRHSSNRMRTHLELGHNQDVAIVQGLSLQATFGAKLVRPPRERLTESQRDACESVERGIAGIPWVTKGDDLTILLAPFLLQDGEIIEASKGRRTLSLHIEDPYALHTNLARVRHMTRAASEAWVATNDVGAMIRYRELVGDRVLVCPSLGADHTIALQNAERKIDVLLCGYAYPSRKRFVKDLLPLLKGLNVVIVGDGWEGVPVGRLPTQDLNLSYALHARAKATVCLHRVHGDCADGPMEPMTVNRGFMEGYSGTRVFLDRSREAHPFVDGDVEWYDSPKDLAERLRAYLGKPRPAEADRFAETCRALYTYRARLARVINSVRAPRYLAEIP